MIQLPLSFDPERYARRDDVDTSHDAAASIREIRAQQHKMILNVLEGGDLLTAEEVGDRLGIDVWRRMNELEKEGFITRTEHKGTNRSGRKAFKYMIGKAK